MLGARLGASKAIADRHGASIFSILWRVSLGCLRRV